MPEVARTAITNVRVFDGRALSDERGSVLIAGGVLTCVGATVDIDGAEVVDGTGLTLLPGLIDAHVHLHGEHNLGQLVEHGVTTALDMGAWPPALVDSLRNRDASTDIRSAGTPAVGSAGNHARIPGFPQHAIVTSPAQAPAFVRARVQEGSDYIKVVAEASAPQGPDLATLTALVEQAGAQDRLVVAHAVSRGAYDMALTAGVDVLTHAPLDAVLDGVTVARVVEAGTAVVPTLTMMEGVARNVGRPGVEYAHARDSVTALHQAGATILAGTDANSAPGVPASVPHGESIHRELELLVEAGLTPTEALRAATSLPAHVFSLADRGGVTVGRRADLVLVQGDPTRDIGVTRRIRGVWTAGVRTT